MPLLPVDPITGRAKVAEAEPIVYYKNGMGYTASGAVVVSGGPVVSYAQGIPLDAGGAVCMIGDDPLGANWQNGLKFITDNVAMSNQAIVNYSNGIPMTELGGVAV